MKKRKTKYVLLILIIIGSILLYKAKNFFILKGPEDQPAFTYTEEEGYQSFQEGKIYRYPNAVPLLEIEGDYYEMGLQYGVLLFPEIKEAVIEYRKIIRVMAQNFGIPEPFLLAYIKIKAFKLFRKLPKRFREEIKGVSDGSTVPESTVIAVSLLYDVLGSHGCTGLLMKTEACSIIHGRSQEPFGFGFGGLFGNHTVVVKQRPKGFNEITRMEIPLFMGVETGYNDKGIGYSEETYSLSESHSKGFPIVYLSRLILEKASNLEEVVELAEKYTIGVGTGMIWSDQKNGRGLLLEKSPKGQADKEMEGEILWNFNNFIDSTLAQQEPPFVGLLSFNSDREKLALGFPQKEFYGIMDAVSFFRLQVDEKGRNYSWYGSKSAIANAWGQQTVIFDPNGKGFYMSLSEVFSAMDRFIFYSNDFSISPSFVIDSAFLQPKIKKAGKIRTALLSKDKKLEELIQFASEYVNDPNAHFLVAEEAFKQDKWSVFVDHALKSFQLSPEISEYRFYAALATFYQGDLSTCFQILDGINDLIPEQEIYRLAIMIRTANNEKSKKELESHFLFLLKQYRAKEHFESKILPKIKQLEKSKT